LHLFNKDSRNLSFRLSARITLPRIPWISLVPDFPHAPQFRSGCEICAARCNSFE
jgi:hypothetical protein